MSQWEEKEPLLRVFDARIDKARLYNVRAPSLRSSNYQRCSILKESGKSRSRGMSAQVCLSWACSLLVDWSVYWSFLKALLQLQ